MNDRVSCWPAPAKINRFLRILGRRADGYHDLQTLFILLDWGDEVCIEILDKDGIHRGACNYNVPENEDLAIRAAVLLKEHAGVSIGASISVDKQIPMGAGLGGGSSDAATVLVALNHLWDCGLSLAELADLGQSLGADVPVFVRGRSALATGTGEILEPYACGAPWFVLVMPDLSVSTRDVFEAHELPRNSPELTPEAVARQLRLDAGDNDCLGVVKRRIAGYSELMQTLAQWGHPVMTGTGSAVFIPMPDKMAANGAAQQIKSLYNVRAVGGLERSLLHLKLEKDT